MIQALNVYYESGIYFEVDDNGDEVDTGLPIEILCLEMANNDPLRAQEIYNGLSRHWLNWYLVQRKGMTRARKRHG